MKRELSIKDELRAIQSGELTCSPEKLAACAAYCRKRLAAQVTGKSVGSSGLH